METVKKKTKNSFQRWREGRRMNRQSTEDFGGSEATLYDTVTVDTCRDPFVQAHRVHRLSLVAQMVKNLPALRETRIQSLGWEDPLVKRMATHSAILAWRIPWTAAG